jgi:hypothetical protein
MALTGAVVKGPVSGASVCAFAVDAGARGASLGPCATTAANGAYALSVTTDAAAVLLEASGGTYTDETTHAATTVPSGSLLRSFVPTTAGASSAYLTPLTTLAVNAALAGNQLNAAGVAQSNTALLSSFRLDAALDLLRTAPVVDGTPNAYGLALQAISHMLSNGTTLAELLSSSQPNAFASAFLASYTAVGGTVPTEPPVTPPVTPGTPAGTPSASGTLTVTGSSVSSFSADPTGFQVTVEDTTTKYRFEKAVTFTLGGQTATSTAYVELTRSYNAPGGALSNSVVAILLDPATSLRGAQLVCTTGAKDCGVSIETPAGATHPVTLNFNEITVGGIKLNGQLTGEAPGAAWSIAELPRTTDGVVNISGTNATVVTGAVSTGSGPGGSVRSTTLYLAGGGIMSLVNNFAPDGVTPTGIGASYLPPGGSPGFCSQNCAFTVTPTETGTIVALNGLNLGANMVFNNTIFLGKTQGTLSTSSLGSFTPIDDRMKSINGTREIVFSVLGTSAQAGISMVVVKTRGTSVIQVSVSTGIGAGVYQCFETEAAFIGVPACSGGTVSANGRVVTLNNLTVGGGTTSSTRVTSVLNGTLTARGF